MEDTNKLIKIDEIIKVVDKDNNIIGKAPRSIVNKNKLWHWASYVYIYNTDLKAFIVQKRSMQK